jgi:hypothetical protein
VKQTHRTPRPISRYERDEILAFWAAGLSQRRIGKILDRNSVVIRRVCLGIDRGAERSRRRLEHLTSKRVTRHGGQKDVALPGLNPVGDIAETVYADQLAS